MNIALWVVQALLAALFLFAGGMKFVMSIEEMTKQVPLPGWFLHFIGVVEVLGALGLILPWLTRIRPGLTPLAAAGLAIIMIGATCHLDDRSDRVRIDPAGDRATLCFRSIRPLAAYAAALILGRWSRTDRGNRQHDKDSSDIWFCGTEKGTDRGTRPPPVRRRAAIAIGPRTVTSLSPAAQSPRLPDRPRACH